MKSRPVIFLSAVSKEFRTARLTAANILSSQGYDVVNQAAFPTEAGPLMKMLEKEVKRSQAVIQIVGKCAGAGPAQPLPKMGRVTYTQYEALFAKRKKKRVYYLIAKDGFETDVHDDECPELQELQAGYLQRVCTSGDVYWPVETSAELENRLLKLSRKLDILRKAARTQFGIILTLITVGIMGLSWIGVKLWNKTNHQEDEGRANSVAIEALWKEVKNPKNGEELAAKLLALNELVERSGARLPGPSDHETWAKQFDGFDKFIEARSQALTAAELYHKESNPVKAFELLMLAAKSAGGIPDSGLQRRDLEEAFKAVKIIPRERRPDSWLELLDSLSSFYSIDKNYTAVVDLIKPSIQAISARFGANFPDIVSTLEKRLSDAESVLSPPPPPPTTTTTTPEPTPVEHALNTKELAACLVSLTDNWEKEQAEIAVSDAGRRAMLKDKELRIYLTEVSKKLMETKEAESAILADAEKRTDKQKELLQRIQNRRLTLLDKLLRAAEETERYVKKLPAGEPQTKDVESFCKALRNLYGYTNDYMMVQEKYKTEKDRLVKEIAKDTQGSVPEFYKTGGNNKFLVDAALKRLEVNKPKLEALEAAYTQKNKAFNENLKAIDVTMLNLHNSGHKLVVLRFGTVFHRLVSTLLPEFHVSITPSMLEALQRQFEESSEARAQ